MKEYSKPEVTTFNMTDPKVMMELANELKRELSFYISSYEHHELLVRAEAVLRTAAQSARERTPMKRIRQIGECEDYAGMICRRYYPGDSACEQFGGKAKCLLDLRERTAADDRYEFAAKDAGWVFIPDENGGCFERTASDEPERVWLHGDWKELCEFADISPGADPVFIAPTLKELSALRGRAASFIRDTDPFGDHFSRRDLIILETYERQSERTAAGAGEREAIAQALWIRRGGKAYSFLNNLQKLRNEPTGDPYPPFRDCLLDADAILALRFPSADAMREVLPRWQHKKRGTTYTEIGRGNMQTAAETSLEDMEPVVIYRSESDGSIWVRSVAEFEDGRFVALAQPQVGEDGK